MDVVSVDYRDGGVRVCVCLSVCAYVPEYTYTCVCDCVRVLEYRDSGDKITTDVYLMTSRQYIEQKSF